MVFVVVFVSNMLTAYFFDMATPDSYWRWDITTSTAGISALILALIFGFSCRKKTDDNNDLMYKKIL